MFQVCFSVEVFRFDIRDALWERTADHYHVTREELVFSDFDYATYLDVEAPCVLECSLPSGTTEYLLLILLIILLTPFIVFVCVLNHGNCHDTAHRHKGCRRSIKVLQTWHQLQERHEEEICISHFAELLE